MRIWFHHAKLIAVFTAVLGASLATPRLALSATYYVDGACANSGTGTSLGCGASGPFKTISEGISAMAPGDTLNIRGAHDGFDGLYNEYVGVWGTAIDAYPGKALNCTAGSPCVVQGCPASVCGSDETPTVTGLVRRVDWTQLSGGVWRRTMEIDTEYIPGGVTGELADDYNPGIVLQGDERTHLQYGTSNAPAEGHWFYEPATHRVYVNPIGTGNPNTDTKLWVPTRPALFVIQGWSNDCPAAPNCPPTNYVTFRRLSFEGARYKVMAIINGNDEGGNTQVYEDISARHAASVGILGSQFINLTMKRVTIEHIARGHYNANGLNGFAMRIFLVNGGTLEDFVTSRIGSPGNNQFEAPWSDPPFNDNSSNNGSAAFGAGIDLKQSAFVAVRNHKCEDVAFLCFHFDVSHDCTLDGFDYQRVRHALLIREYTRSGSWQRNYNLVIRNGVVDNAGYNDGGAIGGSSVSGLSTGEFAYKIYNVMLSRVSYSGISVDSADKVSLWNNTIWSDRSPLGYGGLSQIPPDGIKITGTVTNLDVRNNIIAGMSSDGVEVAAGTTTRSPTFDYDLHYDAGQRSCAVRWGSTCYASVAAFRGATGKEVNGREGPPQFVNTGSNPPDLHLQPSSAAQDAGASLSAYFATDFSGESRPYGTAWDIGADEHLPGGGGDPAAPTLYNVVPLTGS